LLIVFCLLPDK